jgi:hypothetical protein
VVRRATVLLRDSDAQFAQGTTVLVRNRAAQLAHSGPWQGQGLANCNRDLLTSEQVAATAGMALARRRSAHPLHGESAVSRDLTVPEGGEGHA